jgi:hypothetical protein
MDSRMCGVTIAIVLCATQVASAERFAGRSGRSRGGINCAVSAPCKPYISPCFCYKYPIATFPTGGGGMTTVYMGERHNEGCPPDPNNTEGYCDEALTAYLMGPAGIPTQNCLSCQCNARYESRDTSSLARPVAANHTPAYGLGVRELHWDYIEFEVSRDRWVRAKIFLVSLPPEAAGGRNRISGVGFEVESTSSTDPSYRVRSRYVERSTRDPYLYYVDQGGMRYGVIVSATSAPIP